MADPDFNLPEPPEDTERTRTRLVAEKIARQQAEDTAASLAYNKATYPASPVPSSYSKQVTDALTGDQEYGGTSTDSEALFPKPKPPPKKQTGATGPTGPPKPTPTQNNPATNLLNNVRNNPATSELDKLNNPALKNFDKQVTDSEQNPDWRDRAAAQADSLQNQFHGPPQMTGYNWHAGSGGVSGGNDAGMIAHFSDGTSHWVNTSVPGQIPTSPPTTQDTQNSLLNNAQKEGAGGGILPGWNSPTGQNINLTSYGPREVDTSAAGPTPPSGWLKYAIAAAQRGADTYGSGGIKSEGNSPGGQIINNPQGTTSFGTPSGGIAEVSTPKVNPGILFEGMADAVHEARAATTDRTNLINAINQSTTPFNATKQDQGGNY